MLLRLTHLLALLAVGELPPRPKVLNPGEKPGSIPCASCGKAIDEPCSRIGTTPVWCAARVDALRAQQGGGAP